METQTKNVLYNVTSGSTLYGLNDENSDLDYDIVAFPTPSQIFGVTEKAQNKFTKTVEVDTTVYMFHKFCQMLSKGSIKVTEILFAPPELWVSCDPLFKQYFVDRKDDLIAKNVLFSLLGFAQSNFERLHQRPEGTSKRVKLFDQFGYDTKYLAHTWRILTMGKHFIDTGEVKINWSDQKDYFFGIKYGKVSLEDALSNIEELQAFVETGLPQGKTCYYEQIEKLNQLSIDFSVAWLDKHGHTWLQDRKRVN